MKSLAPNTLLQNRYLVVHLIGKGGMGDVYLAVDQRLGSAVALKRTFFSDDEMLGSAFEREAKTLARLRHPVLPKVSDHFIENGEQYLVMEHIAGDDLSKRLEAAQKAFPLSWVLFWADQLLDSLAYLHAHEPPIIHRDIKPQNLKLTDENSIILLDFGLSKNNTGESRVVSGGSTGSIVGYTPHYAPMEQIRGTGTNPRSDLYSLSATLYQLMTNIVPADSLTRADALINDLNDPIKSIDKLNPEVSPAVSSVILKGMEISQDRRFASAREMQKALRDAYANMQNAMTAQTVAFNIKNEKALVPELAPPPPSEPISQSQEKTEVLNIQPADLPPALATNDIAKNAGGTASTSNDATMRMDAPPQQQQRNSGELKQSDVKTEAFVAGAYPEIAALQNQNKFGEDKNKSADNFSGGDNFGGSQNKENSGGYTPEATVPLFNYDKQDDQKDAPIQPGDSMFFTNPNINTNAVDSFATYTPSAGDRNDFKDEAEPVEPIKTAEPPPVVKTTVPDGKKTDGKKSGGKILAIIGGLGALLILAVGGIGGGWYYYKNYYAGGTGDNPPASPQVEFTPSFTPELQGGSETNANSDNSNIGDNTNSSDTNVSFPTNTDDTNISTPPPTPLPGQVTPPPTRTPIQRITPTPTRSPIQRITPTPTKPPGPGKTPIILQ